MHTLSLPGPLSVRVRRFGLLALLTLVAGNQGSRAAGKPPEWTQSFPTGVQQGQSAEITLVGSFDAWPPSVDAAEAGLSFVFGKDAKKKQLTVTAAGDARTGIHWIRLLDDEGATSPRPIFVGSLPEVVEKEPNNEVEDSLALTASSSISGKLEKSNDVDGYRMHVDGGQTLVASLYGHRWIGSPMDAVLQVCDDQGFVLAQDDDERGLDPVLVWQADRERDVIVRVFAFPSTPNSSIRFAGGSNFIYRLDVTTGPCIAHGLPTTVSPGGDQFQLFGWNLDSQQISQTPLSGSALHRSLSLPGASGMALVDETTLPSIAAAAGHEPQAIVIPAVISGRLPEKGDSHHFVFDGVAKQRLRITAESLALGFSLDPIVVIKDSSGKVVAESDNISRRDQDAALDFAFPADGKYSLTIRDTHGRGGSRMVYRLTISEPAFQLTSPAERFVIEPGKTLEIKVTVNRDRGFAESIQVEAVGLPQGVTAESVVSEAKGDSAKSVTLKLASDGKQMHRGPFQIVGAAGEVKRYAVHAVADSPQRIQRLWVTAPPSKSDGM